jgi:cell division protein FtsA
MQQMDNNLIFGLDIGTRSIVGILGYEIKGGFHVVASHMELHETRSMIDGQIHDIDQVALTIRKVKESLERKTNKVLTKVCIAAAGRVLETMETSITIEIDESVEITEELIQSLELQGMEKAMHQINYKDAAKELPFYCVGYSVTKYYLNNFEMTNLLGHKGTTIGVDVLSTFLPAEVVNSLYKVMELVGLEVYSLTLEPIAAIQVAIPKEFRLLNIALVDIGAGTSDIAITKGGSIIAYGMIPTAGDEITESIVHQYLVDFKTAEKIKIKASGRGKTVSFKDAIGLKQTIELDHVRQTIEQSKIHLAKLISRKIEELNGGQSTNAVFIVGGGGQLDRFTELIAEDLQLAKERVAIRGKDVLANVTADDKNFKKNPEYVTPIGICLTGLQNNQHDFVEVFLNDESIRIFNTNRLTVMDIVALKGIEPKAFIPSRGNNLTFTFDGQEKVIKGQIGEPAQIYVNQKAVDLAAPIKMHDYIIIIPAKKGEDASVTIDSLLKGQKYIRLNDEKKLLDIEILVNQTKKSRIYSIENHDVIDILYPTLNDVLEAFSVTYSSAFVNEEKASEDQVIHLGDQINTFQSISTPETIEDKPDNTTIHVMVNQENVQLSGKDTYVFVDVFDSIEFDRTKPKGTLVTTINHQKAGYMDPIQQGDYIEIYWQK